MQSCVTSIASTRGRSECSSHKQTSSCKYRIRSGIRNRSDLQSCTASSGSKYSTDSFRVCHGGITHEGRLLMRKPFSGFDCTPYLSYTTLKDQRTPSLAVETMMCIAAVYNPA